MNLWEVEVDQPPSNETREFLETCGWSMEAHHALADLGFAHGGSGDYFATCDANDWLWAPRNYEPHPETKWEADPAGKGGGHVGVVQFDDPLTAARWLIIQREL